MADIDKPTPEELMQQVDKTAKRIDPSFEPIKSGYFKNVAGSVKEMANEYLGSNAPKIKESLNVVSEFRKQATQYYKNSDLMGKVAKSKSNMQTGIRDMVKNTFDDLKSGDINGSRRTKVLNAANDPFGDDDFGSDFDFDDSAGSDYSSDISDVGDNISAVESAVSSIADANAEIGMQADISRSSQHIESTGYAKEQVNYLAQIAHIQKESLEPMSQSVREFNDKVSPLMTDIKTLTQDISEQSKRSTALQVWKIAQPEREEKDPLLESFEDTFNYDIGSVKDNFMSMIADSEVSEIVNTLMDDSFGPSMIQKFIASPIATIAPMLIPKTIEGALKSVDSVIGGVIPKLVMNLTEKGNEKGGLLKKLTDTLGYGKMDLTGVDLTMPENKEVPWSYDDSTALRVIIPGILEDIREGITGQPGRVYDYREGVYKTKAEVHEDIARKGNDSFKSIMGMKALGDYSGIKERHTEQAKLMDLDLGDKENNRILKLGYANIAKNALNVDSIGEKVNKGDKNLIAQLMEGYEGKDPDNAAQRFSKMIGLLNTEESFDLNRSIFDARKKATKRHGQTRDMVMDAGLNGVAAEANYKNSVSEMDARISEGGRLTKYERMAGSGGSDGGNFLSKIYQILSEGIVTFYGGKASNKRAKGMITDRTENTTRMNRIIDDEESVAEKLENNKRKTLKEDLEDEKKFKEKQEKAAKKEERIGDIKEKAVGYKDAAADYFRGTANKIGSGFTNTINAFKDGGKDATGKDGADATTIDKILGGLKGGGRHIGGLFNIAKDKGKDAWSSLKENKNAEKFAAGGKIKGESGYDSQTIKVAGGEVVLSHQHLLENARRLGIYTKYDNDKDRIKAVSDLLLGVSQSRPDGKIQDGSGLTHIGTIKDESEYSVSKMGNIKKDGVKLPSRKFSPFIDKDPIMGPEEEVKGRSSGIPFTAMQHGPDANPIQMAQMKMAAVPGKIRGKVDKGLNWLHNMETSVREGTGKKFASEALDNTIEGAKKKAKVAGQYLNTYVDHMIRGDFKGVLNAMMFGTKDEQGNKVKKGIMDKATDVVKSVGEQIKAFSDKHIVGTKEKKKDKDGNDITVYEGGFLSPLLQVGSDIGTNFKETFMGENGILTNIGHKFMDAVDTIMGTKDKSSATVSQKLRARLFGDKDEKFGGVFGSMKKTMLKTSKRMFGDIFGYKDLKGDKKRGGGLIQYLRDDVFKKSFKDVRSILMGDRYDKKAKKKIKNRDKDLSMRDNYKKYRTSEGVGRDSTLKETAKYIKKQAKDSVDGRNPTVDYIVTNLKTSLFSNLLDPMKNVAKEFGSFAEAMLTETKIVAKKAIETLRTMTTNIIGNVVKFIASGVSKIPLVKKTLRGASKLIERGTAVVGGVLNKTASFMRNQSVKSGTKSASDAFRDQAEGNVMKSSKRRKYLDAMDITKAKIKDLEKQSHLSKDEKAQVKKAKSYITEYDLIRKEDKLDSKERRDENIKAKIRMKKTLGAKDNAAKGYQKYLNDNQGLDEDKLLSANDWKNKSKYAKYLTDDYQRSGMSVENRKEQFNKRAKDGVIEKEIADIKDDSRELAVSKDELLEMQKQTPLLERIREGIDILVGKATGKKPEEKGTNAQIPIRRAKVDFKQEEAPIVVSTIHDVDEEITKGNMSKFKQARLDKREKRDTLKAEVKQAKEAAKVESERLKRNKKITKQTDRNNVIRRKADTKLKASQLRASKKQEIKDYKGAIKTNRKVDVTSLKDSFKKIKTDRKDGIISRRGERKAERKDLRTQIKSSKKQSWKDMMNLEGEEFEQAYLKSSAERKELRSKKNESMKTGFKAFFTENKIVRGIKSGVEGLQYAKKRVGLAFKHGKENILMIGKSIGNTVTAMRTGITNTIKSIGTGLTNIVSTGLAGIKKGVDGIVTAGKFIGDTFKAGKEAVFNFGNNAINKIATTKMKLKGGITKAKTFAKNTGKVLKTRGENLASMAKNNSLIKGVRSLKGKPFDLANKGRNKVATTLDLGSNKLKEMKKATKEKMLQTAALFSNIGSMKGLLKGAFDPKKGFMTNMANGFKKFGGILKKLALLIPLILAGISAFDIFKKWKNGEKDEAVDKGMNLVSTVAKVGVYKSVKKKAAGFIAEKATKRAATKAAKLAAKTAAKEGGEKVAKGGIKKAIKGIIGKVFTAGPLKSLKALKGPLTKTALKAAPKAGAKLGVKLGGAMISGGLTIAATAAADYLAGRANASNYFQVGPGEKVTKTMKNASGIANAISGSLFGLVPAEMIAKFAFSKMASDEEKGQMAKGQQAMAEMSEKYGVESGDLNSVVNKTVGGKMLDMVRSRSKETEANMKRLGVESKEEYYAMMQDSGEKQLRAKAEEKGWSEEKLAKKIEKMQKRFSPDGDIPVMTKMGNAIKGGFKSAGKGIADFASKSVKGVGNFFKKIGSGILGLGKSMFDTVASGVKYLFSGKLLKDIVGAVKTQFEKIFGEGAVDKIKETFKPLTDFFKKMFIDPISSITNAFSGKLEEWGVFSTIDKVGSAIGGFFEVIEAKFNAIPNVLAKLGIIDVEGVEAEGFGKTIKGARSGVSNIVGGITGFLTDTPEEAAEKADKKLIKNTEKYTTYKGELLIKAEKGDWSAEKIRKELLKKAKKLKLDDPDLSGISSFDDVAIKGDTPYASSYRTVVSETKSGIVNGDELSHDRMRSPSYRRGLEASGSFTSEPEAKGGYVSPKAKAYEDSYGSEATTDGIDTTKKMHGGEIINIEEAYARIAKLESNSIANVAPAPIVNVTVPKEAPEVVDTSLRLMVDLMAKLVSMTQQNMELTGKFMSSMLSRETGVAVGNKPVTSASDLSELAELQKRAEKLASGM